MPQAIERPESATAARGAAVPLHVAKAQFSELFQRVLDEGPQRVTRHGKDEVVIISADEYDRLRAAAGAPRTAYDLLAPLRGLEWDFEREDDHGREVDL